MFFTYNKTDGIQLNMENSSISKAFSIRRFVLKMSLMKILTLNNVIYVVDIRTNLVFSSLLNTYSFKQSFKRVLKPGPARRVDPGPSRPGPGIGPGGGKNPFGNWPGKTRSTRQVDPGPGPPGQFFLY